MSRLFFKTLFRNLWKHKTYSFLNIFGLAIGIACASLIFLWVEDELNFDNYPKQKNLYVVLENQTYDGSIRTYGSTPGPMAPAMQAEVPGIANTCRLSSEQILFSIQDKDIYEYGIYADASVFSMFSLKFVQGNAQQAFKGLRQIVITQRMAHQFFGDSPNVVGQVLKADNQQNYVVSGVIENLPANSTLRYDWIIPFQVALNAQPELHWWYSNTINTYVELQPGANLNAINRQLYNFINQREPDAVAKPFLFAMKDWRLRWNFENGKQSGGRIQYVRLFTIIAWVILLIACINFMNLSTARSEKRAKEIGVRKVLGAGRGSLTVQFMGEAIMLSFLAVLWSVLITLATLPAFNLLVEKQLNAGLTQPLHLIALFIITLICGLLSGSYPAIFLSSFNPVQVLKKLKANNGSTEWLRKSLTVVQFTISIGLVISTIIIFQQVAYVKNRSIGYNKNNLLLIEMHGNMAQSFEAIRHDLINTGLVENAGLLSRNVFSTGSNSYDVTWPGKDVSKQVLISFRRISDGLIPALGLTLKEGQDFSGNPADSAHVIVTQSFVDLMGKKNAIGVRIQTEGDKPNTRVTYTIAGVVNNYVYGDMYGNSDPVIFFYQPLAARYIYVRYKPVDDVPALLTCIEAIFKKHTPQYPFASHFTDEQFNYKFKSEVLVGKLSGVFAALAVIISCLGLFGLAAYTAERRTKEIGIRKVLGASVTGIVGMLSTEFLVLIVLASVLAFPLAWWGMNQWLQSYAYRISINPWVFVLAAVVAMLIALLTVSFQAIKSALLPPVKSLRTE
jgi:putative ABC transport system permease protein